MTASLKKDYPYRVVGLCQHFQTAVTKFVFNTKHQIRNSVIPKHSHKCRDIVHGMGQLHGSFLWYLIQMLRQRSEVTEMFCIVAALTVSLSPGLQSYAMGFQVHLYNKEMKTA